MKTALILGCSHAVGAKMHQEPGLSDDDQSLGDAYGLSNCYPVTIANKMGYRSVNLGISGGSNDAMFRLFMGQKLKPGDIVIACWTGADRSEIYDDNKNWIPLTANNILSKDQRYRDYHKQWALYSTHVEMGLLNKIKNILALNALAQSQGIRVVNIDSFWPVPDFKWPGFVYWPVATDLWSYCQQNKYPYTDCGHFYEPAHRAFAEFILKELHHFYP